MGEARTPRQVAKEQTDRRIRQIALRQLADSGVGELSLRAVARELGLVSSAIYRYYASRDDLLTTLILDAYRDLAAAIEAGAQGAAGPREQWTARCAALRAWAVAQPHRFSLIYGSVIPGYQAPQDTVEPAAAVVVALISPVAQGVAPAGQQVTGELATQAEQVAQALGFPVDAPLIVGAAAAFARLIGLLTLELGGHLVGGFEPADAFYAEVVRCSADSMGLR